LNPDGIVVVQMNDRTKRDTAIESVSHIGKACVACDAALDPCIAGNQLYLWETEVLHETYTLGVFAEICVQEAVSAGVLVGIAERKLVTDRVLFPKAKCVTDAYAIICTRKQPRAIKV
jgi:hypothetical protein